MMTRRRKTRFIAFFVIISAFILAYMTLLQTGVIELLNNTDHLKIWITGFGYFGPLIIITLMATAIIISPLPSAPIALVAGAIYGHTSGTIYIIVGAEIGAIIAFLSTRLLDIKHIKTWLSQSQLKYMSGSQSNLMTVVFISRLLPFISFDIVSYAAGLTQLSFWRFAIATLAGIVPASFLLAHFGSQLTSPEEQNITITLLLLAAISLGLMLIKKFSMKE